MTINDSPHPREYFYLTWQISSLGRRTALAATAFLFEALISIVLLVLTASRTEKQYDLADNLNIALLFILFLILPVALTCWLIWHRDSARLRELNTKLLNDYADESSFAVPRMSPLTMKYAPEAAAILAVQAIIAIYFSAVGPIMF